MIPLLPYLAGLPVLGVSLAVSALAAFIGGGIVCTAHHPAVLVRDGAATGARHGRRGVTFGIGHLVGTVVW